MKTLAEIEQRAESAKARLNEILLDISKGFEGREHRAGELAEELALLLHESKALQVSLVYFRETAENLMSADCSGPH